MASVTIGNIEVGEGRPLLLIAGPCVIESEAHYMDVATSVREIANRVSVPLVFKASYDKANRTSVTSFRGPGIDEGLRILSRVKQ